MSVQRTALLHHPCGGRIEFLLVTRDPAQLSFRHNVVVVQTSVAPVCLSRWAN
jgi:hypothetical protein